MPKANETAAARAGFNDKGEPFPGVNPETGERMAVTLEGLKKEFGPSKGERVYKEIRSVLTEGRSDAFTTAGSVYQPDLSLVDLKPEMRARVDEVLARKES